MTCSTGTKRSPSGMTTNRGSSGGHLDTRDPLLGAARRADDNREVQREVADVRERMRRVDGERRQHREDPVLEHGVHVLAVLGVERCVVREPKTDVGELLDDVAESVDLTRRDIDGPRADLGELLVDGHAVGAERRDTGSTLLDEATDSHLEELVEVRARDGQELGALQQHSRRILSQLEHPCVEVEPAQMPVDVAVPPVQLDGVIVRRGGGHRSVVGGLIAHLRAFGECHQPSSSIAPESRNTRSSAMLVTRSAIRSRWCAMNTRFVARKTVVLSSVIIWMRSSKSRW